WRPCTLFMSAMEWLLLNFLQFTIRKGLREVFTDCQAALK
ncbi:MAG: hypothetical protein RL248_2243, partial [Pseudomonadota bacterium]